MQRRRRRTRFSMERLETPRNAWTIRTRPRARTVSTHCEPPACARSKQQQEQREAATREYLSTVPSKECPRRGRRWEQLCWKSLRWARPDCTTNASLNARDSAIRPTRNSGGSNFREICKLTDGNLVPRGPSWARRFRRRAVRAAAAIPGTGP